MDKQYKYALEKGSKKFLCPKCEQKTFVKYINQETGDYLSDSIGRCDRETSCGHHCKPSNEVVINYTQKEMVVKKPITYHSEDEMSESYYFNDQSSFIRFLKATFENNQNELESAIEKFKIGHYGKTKDSTVFWQIDDKNNIHAGKIMIYNPETGKRSKGLNDTVPVNWMHKVTSLINFNLEQCLFGLQQLNKVPLGQKIGIVESEKTAIILSIMYPDYIWMATGGKQNFKEAILAPIKDYTIVAFPDKDEFNDWNNKAKTLNKLGYKIEVNNWLENIDCDSGTDLADIVVDLKRV